MKQKPDSFTVVKPETGTRALFISDDGELKELDSESKPAQGESDFSSATQKIAEELTTKIAGSIDAHLFESIVSLFNSGVLVHYVRSPRSTVDVQNFKMTVEAASGVKFEGREKIIALEIERDKLERERDELKAKELMLLTSLGSAGDMVTSLKEEIAALRADIKEISRAVVMHKDLTSAELYIRGVAFVEANAIRDARKDKP